MARPEYSSIDRQRRRDIAPTSKPKKQAAVRERLHVAGNSRMLLWRYL